jgi:hypothetical protein
VYRAGVSVRWLRCVCALAAAVALLLCTRPADASLRLKWDCYLPSGGVDCAVLESSLTSKIPFVVIVPDAASADVLATLTSVPAEDGTRFKLDFVGKIVDGYDTEVHTTDRIPSSIDSATATVRILTKIERGLDDFMDQKIAAEVKNGTLDIQVLDPVRMPFTGRPQQSGVKWYVAPTLSSYFSSVQGIGVNASGSASVGFNLSQPSWRLQQWVGANYSRQSQPVPGTTETASIEFAGGSAGNVLSWGLTHDQKWNLGLLAAAEKNPQANYTFRANASLGVELDLVPRQTVNQKNFGFRCAAGPEAQRYDAINIEGIDRQLVAREFCDLFLSWHFVPVDVWASVGETAILEDLSYRAFNASLSLTWRVTDNFMISPWVNVQQINQAINEARPSNVVYADPREEIEASMLATVQQGYTAPFGVQAGLSVRFVLGNGSLSIEDQRWRNVSNLR